MSTRQGGQTARGRSAERTATPESRRDPSPKRTGDGEGEGFMKSLRGVFSGGKEKSSSRGTQDPTRPTRTSSATPRTHQQPRDPQGGGRTNQQRTYTDREARGESPLRGRTTQQQQQTQAQQQPRQSSPNRNRSPQGRQHQDHSHEEIKDGVCPFCDRPLDSCKTCGQVDKNKFPGLKEELAHEHEKFKKPFCGECGRKRLLCKDCGQPISDMVILNLLKDMVDLSRT